VGYMCDICGQEMRSKSAGHFYDQNRVLTSPSYWRHVFTKGTPLEEDALGLMLMTFSKDPSGFTVCNSCDAMLSSDMELAGEYDLAGFIESISSGQVNTHSAGKVAGTVWEKIHGHWPSTIQLGGGGPSGKLVPKEEKKWWQFWK